MNVGIQSCWTLGIQWLKNAQFRLLSPAVIQNSAAAYFKKVSIIYWEQYSHIIVP